MSLILTTSHSILTLDPATGTTHRRRHGEGLYYGLARTPSGQLLTAARGRQVSAPTPPDQETGAILILTPDWRLETAWRPPFPLRDLHEIAWHHDALWATCSHDDLIAIRRPDGTWQRWWPLGQPPDGSPPDRFHFNSLLFEDDQVWVLAHQRGPSRLLAFPIEAALAGHTVPPTRDIELGLQAHNIWRLDGNLCTCSSAEGALVSETGWRLEVGGFTRGIARIPGGWAVGVSELAERRERDLTTGQVVFFDQAWRETGRIALPGEGLVLDLLWSED